MKKVCLIILYMLLCFLCFASAEIAKADVYAVLNNYSKEIGSYRIGFSSTPVNTLSDVPTSINNNVLLSVPEGSFSASNNSVYLFFQIINNEGTVKLTLEITPFYPIKDGQKDETKPFHWNVSWQRIVGVIADGTLDSSNESLQKKEILSFSPSPGTISTSGSVLLRAVTKSIENIPEINSTYNASVILTISRV